jgi:hypothetical protein
MADNLDVKDAAAATKTLRTKDLGSQHLPYHALMDSSGAEMLGTKVSASSVPVVLPTDMALLGRGIVNPSDTPIPRHMPRATSWRTRPPLAVSLP